MNLTHRLASLAALALLLFTIPAQAQDSTSTARDPAAMAQRWLGWSGGADIPPPAPFLEVGATTQFWVSKAGRATPTQITATLADSKPFLEIWVEEGLDFKTGELDVLANQMQNTFIDFQNRANQGGFTTFPRTSETLEAAENLSFSDIDGDGRLTILFAHDLNTTRNMLYNPVNDQPAAFVTNGWTNQQAMFIINTSASPGLALSSLAYQGLMARAFYNALIEQNNPAQAPWLREAQSWYMLLQYSGIDIGAADFQTFFNTPDLSLTSNDTDRSAITAVGQMFLLYVRQRFPAVFRELFSTSGSGLAQLTRILSDHGITDLITGQPVTGQDVFADFAMTNALNLPIGDTRFYYVLAEAANLRAAAPGATDYFDFQVPDFTVQQYGTNYLALSATKPVEFQLTFDGAATVARLPMPADQPNNHFYWSGNGLYQNTSLSRPVDLTAVKSATLTFDAWHQLSEGWNYGYFSVSDDGGKTFKILVSNGTTTTNPYGLSYGFGFTGVSNPQPSRPFPYLGIGLEANGITISSIADNSPLKGLDVQVGDTIAGFDGQPWQTKADITDYLSKFQPGDTVNLYMQRGESLFSVDVVLGKHPSRVIPASPIWTQQEVNLNPYVGKQIVLRFDYVSADDVPDKGIAIDNIAIPEIGLNDDAESGVQGWTLNGWQQIDNILPQRYIVQYALLGADAATTRTERLISPGDTTTAGTWTFTLNANDALMLAISGINDATDTQAVYSLSAQTLSTPQPAADATAESTPAQ